jgi:hypothetical protein
MSCSQRSLPVVVTVLEAGPLERQVCLLVESLRRWGGRLAGAPVVAVNPRLGPNVCAATRAALRRLNVDFCRVARDDGFEWFPYLNKTTAVRHVATQHSGPVVWLDADILILNEPEELLFDSHFAACASDKNIGTTCDDDEFAPYFRAACEAFGIDFKSLPYVLTEREQIPVRAYWNSGVYALGRDCLEFAELHHQFTTTLLSKGIASHESRFFFSDQISLGLAAHQLGLRPHNLPLRYNYHVQPEDADKLLASEANIRILHYHGCLWPSSFDNFCGGLKIHFPEVANWLRTHGPLANDLSPVGQLSRKVLAAYRQRRHNIALRRARFY